MSPRCSHMSFVSVSLVKGSKLQVSRQDPHLKDFQEVLRRASGPCPTVPVPEGSSRISFHLCDSFIPQNCRVDEVGKDPRRPSSPASRSNQGQEEVARGCILSGFECHRRQRLHDISDNLLLCLSTLQNDYHPTK